MAVVSPEPEIANLPVASMATDVTPPEWPLKDAIFLPVAES